jgi:signal transduction histidine kinase
MTQAVANDDATTPKTGRLFAQATAATRSAAEFGSIFEKLIEGLPEQIALLDENWVVLAVNDSWAGMAKVFGYDLVPGSSYRTFCLDRGASGYHAAAAAAAAIDDLEHGDNSSLTINYAGQGELEGRQFRVQIHRFEIGGKRFATVTRSEVTELLELRRMKEGLSGTLERTQEMERQRIARELHDSTMQSLTGAALALGHLRRSAMSPEANEVASEIESLLIEAQNELRSISYLAYAHQLENQEIGPAVSTLVEGFARRAGLHASVEVGSSPTLPPREAQGALYRVVQEAISNAHRHARGSEIAVRFVTRRSLLHVTIADNGIGMPDKTLDGVGLQSMRARLREVGGRLSVRHLKPGTIVIASVPVGPDPAQAELIGVIPALPNE